jgi:hypothetical protein
MNGRCGRKSDANTVIPEVVDVLAAGANALEETEDYWPISTISRFKCTSMQPIERP